MARDEEAQPCGEAAFSAEILMQMYAAADPRQRRWLCQVARALFVLRAIRRYYIIVLVAALLAIDWHLSGVHLTALHYLAAVGGSLGFWVIVSQFAPRPGQNPRGGG